MKRSQFNPGEQRGSLGLFGAIFGTGEPVGTPNAQVQAEPEPEPSQEKITPRDGGKVVPTVKEVSIGISPYGDTINLPIWERHTIIAGQSGSGKSWTANRMLAEIFKIEKDQRLVAIIDCKGAVEGAKWQRVANAVAGTIEEANTILTNVDEEMKRREALVKEDIEGHWDSRIHPDADTPLIVIYIDELAVLGNPIKEDKELEAIRKNAMFMLNELLFRGRSSAIAIIVAIQRPDASLMGSGSMRNNLQNRIVGRMDSSGSSDIALGLGMAKEGYDASKLTNHWFYASIEGKGMFQVKTPGVPDDSDLREVAFGKKYEAIPGAGDWLTAEPESPESIPEFWRRRERLKNAEKDSISWDSAYRRNDSYDDDAYDEGDDLGAEFDEDPSDDLPFDEDPAPNRPASSQQPPAPAPVDLATMAAMLGVSVEQLEELQRQNGTNPQPASSRTNPRSAPSRPTRGERAAAREARAAEADSLVVETRKASRRPLTDEQIVERGADLMRDIFREIDDYLDEQEEFGAEFSEEEDDELMEDVDDSPIATSDDDDFGLDLDTPDVSDLPEFASGPEELVRKTRRMNMETEFSGLRNLVTSGSTTNGPDSRPEAEWEVNRKQPIPAPPHRRPAVASSEHPVDKKGQEPGGLTVERRRQARQAKPERADTTAKKEQSTSDAKPSASGGRGKRTAPARQRNYQRR